MASGHEYRTRRPNTWLLRPTPLVKSLLANPGLSTHVPSVFAGFAQVSFRRKSRRDLLIMSITARDPQQTWRMDAPVGH
jgi:hypothetical protein